MSNAHHPHRPLTWIKRRARRYIRLGVPRRLAVWDAWFDHTCFMPPPHPRARPTHLTLVTNKQGA